MRFDSHSCHHRIVFIAQPRQVLPIDEFELTQIRFLSSSQRFKHSQEPFQFRIRFFDWDLVFWCTVGTEEGGEHVFGSSRKGREMGTRNPVADRRLVRGDQYDFVGLRNVEGRHSWGLKERWRKREKEGRFERRFWRPELPFEAADLETFVGWARREKKSVDGRDVWVELNLFGSHFSSSSSILTEARKSLIAGLVFEGAPARRERQLPETVNREINTWGGNAVSARERWTHSANSSNLEVWSGEVGSLLVSAQSSSCAYLELAELGREEGWELLTDFVGRSTSPFWRTR